MSDDVVSASILAKLALGLPCRLRTEFKCWRCGDVVEPAVNRTQHAVRSWIQQRKFHCHGCGGSEKTLILSKVEEVDDEQV